MGFVLLLIGFDIHNGGLASGSHKIPHSGLNVANIVILFALAVIVIDVKSNILTRFEDEIDDEAFAEIGVKIVLDGFGLTEGRILVLAEISFEGDL